MTARPVREALAEMDRDAARNMRERMNALGERARAAEAECERLRAALDMADKWESDGRPDGIMHLIARLRAAREGGAR